MSRVAVVGAGIVGASIAWHLARRGCDVVVFEKNKPASQASGNSFAWINASYVKLPYSYHLLSTHSIFAWRKLAGEVRIPIRFGGCLEWVEGARQQAELAAGVATVQRFGAPSWMIDPAKARELEPSVEFLTEARICHSELDGAIDPAATTGMFLDLAKEAGAQLVFPETVQAIEQGDSGVRVVTSGSGVIDVEKAVIAAGVGATAIAGGLGVELPQRTTPGYIVTTGPMPEILRGVVVAPGVHIHQRNDGRVVIGEQGGAPDTDSHRRYLGGRPNAYPSEELANQHAARILGVAHRYVPRLRNSVVERVGIGWRPLPLDGLPVVGASAKAPDVHFAVMHSGVTLAPIIGHLSAMEILDGVRVDPLADFRPDRFAT